MTITIDNAIERLNTPRAIFDEEITKANLIPVFEELKANDDEDDMLDLLLYRISDADYFDDMSWILTQISEDDEDYPKTHRFLENIIENVKKEYTSTELTDLCDVIADKLTNARSTSSFTSFLECSEDFDSATVTILNGTHYLENSLTKMLSFLSINKPIIISLSKSKKQHIHIKTVLSPLLMTQQHSELTVLMTTSVKPFVIRVS